MPLNNLEFLNADEFYPWSQGTSLSDCHLIVDYDSQSSHTIMASKDGMCWAYCIDWVNNIKVNKRYRVNNLSSYKASLVQSDLLSRHSISNTSNALLLCFPDSRQHDFGITSIHNPLQVNNALDHIAGNGFQFLMITLTFPTNVSGRMASHAIVLKLNTSIANGVFNRSYPCSMFDPNIGQAFYKKQSDMALDLLYLYRNYNSKNMRMQGVAFKNIN